MSVEFKPANNLTWKRVKKLQVLLSLKLDKNLGLKQDLGILPHISNEKLGFIDKFISSMSTHKYEFRFQDEDCCDDTYSIYLPAINLRKEVFADS